MPRAINITCKIKPVEIVVDNMETVKAEKASKKVKNPKASKIVETVVETVVIVNPPVILDNDTITFENMKNIFEFIVSQNKYVKNCISTSKKDPNSFSYIVEFQITQSDCIKLGNGIEGSLRDAIAHLLKKKLKVIDKKNTKGKQEIDHLFVDDDNKIVYYAELKTNINLDTEKCKATVEKCLKNQDDLKKEYPNYEIKMFLVACRYFQISKDFPEECITKKYEKIQPNLVGINEYFNALGIKFQFKNENEWKVMVNILANAMFRKVKAPGKVKAPRKVKAKKH